MIKTFPYLEVKGTYYEVGSAIGEMFRGKIQETIRDRKKTISRYEERIEETRPYFKEAKAYFPQLVDEMRGMADGAQVALSDLFFHNNPEVYDRMAEWDRERVETSDHCTIAVSFNQKGALVGHNEDWSIESLDELYILKATIANTTFLSLTYATFLPGCSASLNQWGLIQCINELEQKDKVGVPKNFVARAVLECKNLQEAEALILKTNRASGYNHMLVQGDDLWDIEIAGHDIDVVKLENTPYVHTNHCISKHMLQYQKYASQSSRHRYTRAMELVKNDMTKKDMIALLSDTADNAFPICRENKTIASVLIEPHTFTMHICYGMPSKDSRYMPYEL